MCLQRTLKVNVVNSFRASHSLSSFFACKLQLETLFFLLLLFDEKNFFPSLYLDCVSNGTAKFSLPLELE